MSTNLEQQIAHMVNTPGVYICGDSNQPHLQCGGLLAAVVWSTGGKLYALRPDQELDPTRFHETAIICGPFLPLPIK